jgi:hypothetical protein
MVYDGAENLCYEENRECFAVRAVALSGRPEVFSATCA